MLRLIIYTIVFVFILPFKGVFSKIRQKPLDVTLIVDKNFSSFTGSSIAYSTFNIYTYLLPYKNTRNRFIPGALRLLRVGGDFYLASYASLVKHEVFGHGARAREFDRVVAKYEFDFDSGVTYIISPVGATFINEINSGNYFIREALIDTGGIESSDVLANFVAQKSFKTLTLDPGLGLQYFANAFDQLLYIARTTIGSDKSDGNDIRSYRKVINSMYSRNRQGSLRRYKEGISINNDWDPLVNNPEVISMNDIKRGMIISLLDPFLFYSIFTQINYVYTGSNKWRYPTIKIKKINYLPRIRTVLSPYGLSTQLQNYFLHNNKFIIVSIQGGKTANQAYYSLGIESDFYKVSSYIDVGLKMFYWSQPKPSEIMLDSSSKLGALVATKIKININKNAALLTTFGYKGSGFVQGENFKNGLILRGGISLII